VIRSLLERANPELLKQWSPEFDAVHAALMPLIEYIERAEADNVTQQGFFRMKREWRKLTPNAYAAALDQLLDKRFVETADGARCEAAFWLTAEGHAENSPLVGYRTWPEQDVPAELRARVREACAGFVRVKAKIVSDAGIVLPSANRAEIGAEFTRYIDCPDSWQTGGSEFDYWPEPAGTGRRLPRSNSRPLRRSSRSCPRPRPPRSGSSPCSCGCSTIGAFARISTSSRPR
jgi:hypothetical protein